MEDVFNGMRRFQQEVGKMFSNAVSDFKIKEFEGQTFREPLADLKETDSELITYLEIPGVDKQDINLNITENSVEVKVEKKQEEKVEKKGYFKASKQYSGFYKYVTLPCKILVDEVKASYKDGILEIVMPKAEKKKLRKVEVR